MTQPPSIPEIDKSKLVGKIKQIFLNQDAYLYSRKLIEIFDQNGKFIGDNFNETIFKLNGDLPPIIFETSGPYDVFTNDYSHFARIIHNTKLLYQCDFKPGNMQRTAAMTPLFFQTLNHSPKKVLLVGPGKVNTKVAEFLAHFYPKIPSLDYSHPTNAKPEFEKIIAALGIQARYVFQPSFADYDTIIMATKTKEPIINQSNFSTIKPGTILVSYYTTGQAGEIEPELYGRENIQIFMDHPDNKIFTADMRKAHEKGYLDSAVFLVDLLKGNNSVDTKSKINIIRLCGTSFQNAAVMEMVMEVEKISW
jgi:ornithine cyclodeaminase/alanine dehydrogenase-like protein (mu-crystallin family)